MSFFGLGRKSEPAVTNNSFGYKIIGTNGLPSDLEGMKGNIIRTSKRYREELSKYRELHEFNKQVSSGYQKSLEVMVDMSRFLNYYVEIFNILKVEFEKNEKMLGPSLKIADINYLERLTRGKIDELNQRFMAESERLKKMYSENGRSEEANRITETQRNMIATTEAADRTMTNFQRIEQEAASSPASPSPAVYGGAKRRIRLPRYVPLPKAKAQAKPEKAKKEPKKKPAKKST